MQRIALAYPTLHIVLRHNGRLVLEVAGSAGLLDRIHLFFGNEVREKLYPLDAAQGPVKITGWIADPSCERGNSKLQYLFLNGRWIRDRSLGHALQEAYRGLLMTGRYAVAFLFVEMPPDQVDVNVHPTKSEVRFRDGQAMYHLIRAAIKHKLSDLQLVPRLQIPPSEMRNSELGTRNEEPGMFSSPRSERAAENLAPWDVRGTEMPAAVPTNQAAQTARAIQIHDSYLVVETPSGMLVIDQHALHERILFEQLRRRIRDGQLEVQRLLIPEPIDLPADQSACVLEAKEELRARPGGRGFRRRHGVVGELPGIAEPGDAHRYLQERARRLDEPRTLLRAKNRCCIRYWRRWPAKRR